MSRVCQVCGKRPSAGRSTTRRGMAKRLGGVGQKTVRSNKRRFLPNLKKVKVIVEKTKKTMLVCTECIKSGRVKKA
ncbi:MAG: 50S ribosomal protein L28 [Candidatus Omnitrophota bacterium]|nr:MAG: 50S ribosomal protein L28 [Candidatus Omnitrophota bacterium]